MPRLRPVVAQPARLTRDSDLHGLLGLLYGRRSKADPKNPGKSTTDQVSFMQEQFTRRGVVTRAALVDEGIGASRYSAAKVRAAYEEIIRLVTTEDIAIVGLWELSRATRRLKIHGELMELLADRNVLLMVNDRIYDPSDADDELQLGIGAVMNAAEAARGRARTLRGTASAAAMGLPHGQTPYGYTRIYDQRTRALIRIEEVESEAAIIREIAGRVLHGESSRSIARDLQRRKEPRPYGGTWAAPEIRDILTRPCYIGRRFHNGVDVAEGIWPAILDLDTWEELDHIFKMRAHKRGDWSTNAKYLLTGVAVCGACPNGRMHADRSRKQLPTDKRPPLAYRCNKCRRGRNLYAMDSYVTGVVNTLLADPDALRAFMGNVDDIEVQRTTKRLRDLAGELAEAEADLEAGSISAKAYTITERRIEADRSRAQQVLEERGARSSNLSSVLASGISTLDGLPIERQRAMLRKICRVVVYPTTVRGKIFDRDTIKIVRHA